MIFNRAKWKRRSYILVTMCTYVMFFPFMQDTVNVFADIEAQKVILQNIAGTIDTVGSLQDSDGPRVSLEPTGNYCRNIDTIDGSITYLVQASDVSGVASISLDKGRTWEKRDGHLKYFLGLDVSQDVWVSDVFGNKSYVVYKIDDPICVVDSVNFCTVVSNQESNTPNQSIYSLFDGENVFSTSINGINCSIVKNIPTKQSYTIAIRDDPMRKVTSVTDQLANQLVIKEGIVSNLTIDGSDYTFYFTKTPTNPALDMVNVSICMDNFIGTGLDPIEVQLQSEFANYNGIIRENGCYTFYNIIGGGYTLSFSNTMYQIQSLNFNGTFVSVYDPNRQYAFTKNNGYRITLTLDTASLQQNSPTDTTQTYKDICTLSSTLRGSNALGIDYSPTHTDFDCRPMDLEKTLAFALQQLIQDYKKMRQSCVWHNYVFSDYLYDDITNNIYADAIHDLSAYCILDTEHGVQGDRLFRPNDSITKAEALKLLVNTISVFKGMAVVREQQGWYLPQYNNLLGDEWYGVYIPYGQYMGLMDILSDDGLTFYGDIILNQDEAIQLIRKAGFYLGIENISLLQTNQDIITRGGFVSALAKYFGLVGDYTFVSRRFNNLTFLQNIQKTIVSMLPSQQHTYIIKSIASLETSSDQSIYALGLRKDALLQVLYVLLENYEKGVSFQNEAISVFNN